MVSLQEQVGRAITRRRLLPPAQPILVAVSGGVDSMVLLHVLVELSRTSGWKLTVAHLNHQLRGTSSQADERLVRRTAKELGLPIVVSRADVRGLAKKSKVSIEMAARRLRHEFLAGAAVERNIGRVALAHHLDDQVELFFLRLFRGSGSQGLAGMQYISPSPANPAVTLVRPLLDCPKALVRNYAARLGIEFREDASNDALEIQRNRIRHELLPLLEKQYQPAIRKNILRLMDILAAETEFIESATETWLAQNGGNIKGPTGPSPTEVKAGREASGAGSRAWSSSSSFESMPVAIQRRAIQLQLIRKGIPPDYDLIEHLRMHAGNPIEIKQTSAEGLEAVLAADEDIDFRGGLRLVREGGRVLDAKRLRVVSFRAGSRQLDLKSGRGKLEWDGVKLSWQFSVSGVTKVLEKSDGPPNGAGREFFDADSVGSAIILRHWRPGDRFQPIGMSRPVKLQDFFVNEKVPRKRRHRLIVAATRAGELFWVEGMRISDRFKLTNTTIRRLHWAWQRL